MTNVSGRWQRNADNAVGRADMPIKPIEVHEDKELHGTQKIYRFGNNYGASVVKNKYSYGSEDGNWELAVIKFKNKKNNSWELTYITSVAGDVIGHLRENDVENVLVKIRDLGILRGGRASRVLREEED